MGVLRKTGPQRGTAFKGGVVKDSSRLSKRIGWLNANAGFQTQIQYSEVRDLLSSLGDSQAMRVLKEIEQKGSEVRDPTAYLMTAAHRALGNDAAIGAPRTQQQAKGKGKGKSLPVMMAIAGSASQGFAEADKVNRRISWLNHNAGLSQELESGRVTDLLVEMGSRVAMDVLKTLEENAPQVRDPTAYVAKAALRALQGGGPTVDRPVVVRRELPTVSPSLSAKGNSRKGLSLRKGQKLGFALRSVMKRGLKEKREPKMLSSARGLSGQRKQMAERLEKRVRWLNANVDLAHQLVFEKVVDSLGSLGFREAMDILRKLEDNAAGVRDPNAYVIAAVLRALPRQTEALPRGEKKIAARKLVGRFAPGTSGQLDDVSVVKLKKRIAWLNRKAGLSQELNYDHVTPFLFDIGVIEAMGILKLLEENSSVVRDPNAYVSKAAIRLSRTPAPVQQPVYENCAFEEKVWKRIRWLNENAGLQAELSFDEVVLALSPVGDRVCMDILKSLEEKSANIRDPNGFVIAAARRVDGHSAGGARESSDYMFDEKLRKRIFWLNKNGQLAKPLTLNAVAPELHTLDIGEAMDVLKNLEENAGNVRHPDAYIIKAARRASEAEQGEAVDSRGRGGVGKAAQHGSYVRTVDARASGSYYPPAKKPMDAPDPEKIERRLQWMHANVQFAIPLDLDYLGECLLQVHARECMSILKRLEEDSTTVLDPNGYVAAAVNAILSLDS